MSSLPGYRLIERGSVDLGRSGNEALGRAVQAIKLSTAISRPRSETARTEQGYWLSVRQEVHPFVLSLDRIEIVHGELLIVMELADKSLLILSSVSVERPRRHHPGRPLALHS